MDSFDPDTSEATNGCAASRALPPADDALIVAEFVLSRVRRARGRLWDEGPWAEPLASTHEHAAAPALHVFATRRVRGVSPTIARGLLAWSRGERPADVLRHAENAMGVLRRQARGRRCVSMLDDEAARACGKPLLPDGLSFAIHDLHHLEKFVAPEHHLGQVGFFRAMERAMVAPEIADLDQTFDDAWRADRDYVIADMNGSAVFLFAILKMRLGMAVRRRLARERGVEAPSSGRLSPNERSALQPVLATFFDAMGLPENLRSEALQVEAAREGRPHAPSPHTLSHAQRLLDHFEREGQAARDCRENAATYDCAPT